LPVNLDCTLECVANSPTHPAGPNPQNLIIGSDTDKLLAAERLSQDEEIDQRLQHLAPGASD